jgi:hypothetical protein
MRMRSGMGSVAGVGLSLARSNEKCFFCHDNCINQLCNSLYCKDRARLTPESHSFVVTMIDAQVSSHISIM